MFFSSKTLKNLINASLFILSASTASATTIVDYSPDTTNAALYESNWINSYGNQIIGDRFSLTADSFITGGAIFSNSFVGSTGNSARFMIFSDNSGAPSATPLFDILTVLDAVDSTYTTTQTTLTRKHASISEIFLSAGSYWFSMPGNGSTLDQASGTYGDANLRYGSTGLNFSASQIGDMFFQLEGRTATTVPEPPTLALMTFGFAGLALIRRRKS